MSRKPKTRRGKRALDKRGPLTIENTKRAMFIRGGRTSEIVTQALKDLVCSNTYNLVCESFEIALGWNVLLTAVRM